MANTKPSLPVVRRLPRYYRYITEMKNNGVTRTSSSQLASIMGSTSSQVRQDFNCFGGFGQQGVGYSVENLHKEIEKLLFPEDKLRAVLIGTDNLGTPIADFIVNENTGIALTGIFDAKSENVGKIICELQVQPVESIADYCKENRVDILVVCTEKEEAKELSETILSTGVKGIWNYSHFDFAACDETLVVENVHLRDNLMALSYRVTHKDDE